MVLNTSSLNQNWCEEDGEKADAADIIAAAGAVSPKG